MIKGLRLKITSKELKDHCLERAKYHVSRADKSRQEKKKALQDLREALEKVKGQKHLEMATAVLLHGQIESLERDIREHNNKVLVFRYYAEHLFDEDYDLEESDLVKLEIFKR